MIAGRLAGAGAVAGLFAGGTWLLAETWLLAGHGIQDGAWLVTAELSGTGDGVVDW